jgi:TPR repeat protein
MTREVPFENLRPEMIEALKKHIEQYNLGSMHGNGEGVPVDYVKAYMWFSISEATLSGAEREAARTAKGQASKLMMPDDLSRALQMAQRCLTSAYQNCD